MNTYYCLTVRLLDRTFHGRRDFGAPEWPPSPARAFQALVAAAARRNRGKVWPDAVRQALLWLERQPAPTVIAPPAESGSAYCASVPNNAMDIVARAWARGNYSNRGDASPATHHTMKTVRHTYLRQDGAVYYLWQLPDSVDEELARLVETLCECARSVVALGWGIDMAVAHGAIVSEDEIRHLPGEHWSAAENTAGATGLRAPVAGMLDALIARHQDVLALLGSEGLAAPAPMTTYGVVAYRRDLDPGTHLGIAFALLDPETDAMRPFDPTKDTLTVANMMRHAVKRAARHRWSDREVARMVMGHGEARNSDEYVPVRNDDRFAFLPLPTIEFRGPGKPGVVDSIRRVMLWSFARDFRAPMDWARLAMPPEDTASTTAAEMGGTAKSP